MKKEPNTDTATIDLDPVDHWLEVQLDQVRRIAEDIENEYRDRLSKANPLRRMYLRRQMEQQVSDKVSAIKLPPEAFC